MYIIVLDYSDGKADIVYLINDFLESENIEEELVKQGYNLGNIEWMEISKHSLKMLGMQIFENI